MLTRQAMLDRIVSIQEELVSRFGAFDDPRRKHKQALELNARLQELILQVGELEVRKS